jgi:RNA polymerase sigma-70 factor, ECF subfamily
MAPLTQRAGSLSGDFEVNNTEDAAPSREGELIARIMAGERELFHELIRPYEKSLYFAAYSLLKNAHDAEDAVQEAVLKAYKALPTFRREAKFSTWIATIVLNEARGRLRHERVLTFTSIDETPEPDEEFAPAVIADWREVPLESLERKEVRGMIQQAITMLPDIYREVFVLRDVQDMNIAETAKALGITEGLVKVRLLRARLMMQKILAPKLQTGRGGLFGFFRKGAGASWF